jgi:hypothetical protein
MSRPTFSLLTSYLEKSFEAETYGLGGPVLSNGFKTLLEQEGGIGSDPFEVFRTMRLRDGTEIGALQPASMKWVYGFGHSFDETINAYLSTLTPSQLRTEVREVFGTAAQVELDLRGGTVHSRRKAGGEVRVEKAEAMGMVCFGILARPVNGNPPQICAHMHPLYRQVAVGRDGKASSIANPMALAYVNAELREAVQRIVAERLQARGVDAAYENGRAVIRGQDPEFVKAVTGARSQQKKEFLQANALPETDFHKGLAAARTAEPKPEWKAPKFFHDQLAQSLAQAQQIRAAIEADKGEAARQERIRKAFVAYAYDAEAMLKARLPHIQQSAQRKSSLITSQQSKGVHVVHDARTFLEVTKRVSRREAFDRAYQGTRFEILDADWNGVAAIGRIAARMFERYRQARKQRLGPEKGATLIVPEAQWKQLKDDRQLIRFYVRAKGQGWTVQCVGMELKQHERLQRNAEKAIQHGVHKRQQHEGYDR